MSLEVTYTGPLKFIRRVQERIITPPSKPVEISTPPGVLKPDDILITEEEIKKRISEMATNIASTNKDMNFLGITVLNGAMIFGAALGLELRKAGMDDLHLDSIRLQSYRGTRKVKRPHVEVKTKNKIVGRNILVIEDIVDTGETMAQIEHYLIAHGARSITTVCLISKDECRKVLYQPDYVGFKIKNIWVEGMGLDSEEEARFLPYIAVGKERPPRKYEKSPYRLAGLIAQAEMGFTRYANAIRSIESTIRSGTIFSARK